MSDAASLWRARSDPDVMRFWDVPAQTSIAEVEATIAAHDPDRDAGHTLWWAVTLAHSGEVIGECDLSEIDHKHGRAEVGFMFARAHWKLGYAIEAMNAVKAEAFGALGLERLWARCHDGNEASIRLLERLGLSLEGRLRAHVKHDGRRRDCLIYGLVLDATPQDTRRPQG